MILVASLTFQPHIGYGRWARSIVFSLQRSGFNTWITPSGMPIPDDMKHLVRTGTPDIIVYPPFAKSEAPIQFTTYESTKLTPAMVKELRKRRLVAVLSEYNKEMCLASGLENVAVCHPEIYTKYQIPPSFDPFVFIHVSADSNVPERKRTADVIQAFHKAFPVEPNVRLLIKKSPEDQRIPNYDSRIEIIYENLASLEGLYARAHVGVFPSGQEGWGYCQSELMAMGRPVIVPLYGGPRDFCNDLNSYSLSHKMVRVPKSVYNNQGYCARIAVKDITRQLLWCYQNKDDVVLRGCIAYRSMLGFSWSRMDARIKELLDTL